MSFTPLAPGINNALLGAADPGKFIDPYRSDVKSFSERDLEDRRIHDTRSRLQPITYTLIIIIISAIIFVTVIAIYDVFRNLISNHYASIALNDPDSDNTPEDIERTQIANQQALVASIIFAIFCIITAIILIFILIIYLHHIS